MGFNLKNKRLEDFGYADAEIKTYVEKKQRLILKKMIRAHKNFEKILEGKKIPQETVDQVWPQLMSVIKKYSASNPEYCPIKYTNQLEISEMRDAGIDDAVARLIEQMKLRIHFSYEYALHALHPEANCA